MGKDTAAVPPSAARLLRGAARGESITHWRAVLLCPTGVGCDRRRDDRRWPVGWRVFDALQWDLGTLFSVLI